MRLRSGRWAYLTLGYDHRLIDGAVADEFMSHIKQRLENWRRVTRCLKSAGSAWSPTRTPWRFSGALVEDRRADRIGDVLLLVEHPHVLTLGVRGDGGRSHMLAPADVLSARGIEVVEAGRGGDVTYHGPGQIVGYPIIDLQPDRADVHRYVRDLEEVLIRVAADCGVTAGRVEGLTGVWVGDRTSSRPSASESPAGSPATGLPSM